MPDRLKSSIAKLIVGLTILFALVGLYMFTMRIGVFYNQVDGSLTVLPIIRLALMILLVGMMLGLCGTAADAAVDVYGFGFRREEWSRGDGAFRSYKEGLRFPLLLLVIICGYFMVGSGLRLVFSPLEGYGWVYVVYTVLWFVLGLMVAVLLVRRVVLIRRGITPGNATGLALQAEPD